MDRRQPGLATCTESDGEKSTLCVLLNRIRGLFDRNQKKKQLNFVSSKAALVHTSACLKVATAILFHSFIEPLRYGRLTLSTSDECQVRFI